MKILIGIPAYNEEKNIGSIIINLQKKYPNILVCDDGSIDNTSEISKKLGALVIKHQKNQGYGSAIKSIFNKAKEMECDILITFDADGQHRIEDIENILDLMNNSDADIVIGSRFLNSDKTLMPKYRKLGIKAITKFTNVLSGTKITDSQSGFRSYNKKILENITLTDDGMGISTEILIKSKEQGFKIRETPIVVNYDGDTSTHNPVIHGTSVIISTLQFISIQKPLTFYGIPGIIFFSIGLFFSVWAIQIFVEQNKLITNIALIGGISTIFGIILIISASILHSIVILINSKR